MTDRLTIQTCNFRKSDFIYSFKQNILINQVVLSIYLSRLYKMPVRRDGTRVDWAKDIRESWEWGEDGGYSNLREFLDENVGHYENESSRADQKWTAVISPYLHWGELSPR